MAEVDALGGGGLPLLPLGRGDGIVAPLSGGTALASAQQSKQASSLSAKSAVGVGPPANALTPQTALAAQAEQQTDEDEAGTRDDQRRRNREAEAEAASKNPNELSLPEQRQVTALRQIDAQVRRHEQAHAAAGGQFAGAPQFQFARGPDGKRYAVAGEVSIRLPGGSADPQTQIAQLQTVRRAALAPANPSPQDLQVAATARRGIAQARGQLREIAAAERAVATAEARARQEAQTANSRQESQEVLVAEPVNQSSQAAVSASGVPVTKALRAFRKAEALTLDQPVLELNRNGQIIAAVGETARRGDILNIAL